MKSFNITRQELIDAVEEGIRVGALTSTLTDGEKQLLRHTARTVPKVFRASFEGVPWDRCGCPATQAGLVVFEEAGGKINGPVVKPVYSEGVGHFASAFDAATRPLAERGLGQWQAGGHALMVVEG